jgi:hypothetical protein
MSGEGSDDEIDWLAFGGGPLGAQAMVLPDPAAAGPEDGGDGAADGAVVLLVEDPQPMARQLRLPHPRRRSQVEHHFVASRMREGRARKRAARLLERAQRSEALVETTGDREQMVRLTGVRYTPRGGGRGRGFSFQAMLQLACSEITSFADVGRAWKCSAGWVRCVRNAVAKAILHFQSEQLASFQASPDRPTLSHFVASLSFDETTQQLLLPLAPGLLPQQTRSKWHVLVSQATWTLGLEGGESQGSDIVERHVGFLRPPVPLLSTNAEAIYNGLYDMPAVVRYGELELLFLKEAKCAFVHFDRDAATANDRVITARSSKLPSDVFVSDRVCGNHQNNLIEGAILATHFAPLLSQMYSAALLLRNGGYFLRLIHALTEAVDVGHRIRRTPPPSTQLHRLFANEMMDYHIRSYKKVMLGRRRNRVDEASSDDGEPGEQGRARDKGLEGLEASWKEFLDVFNGAIWEGMVHHCHRPECCQGHDAKVTQDRMRRCLAGLLFRAMPTVPVKSKWTKLGPCLDFFLLASCCCRTLPDVWPIAFSKLKVNISIDVHDQAYLEEVNWHAVQGGRAKAGGAMVADPTIGARLVVLALVLEPLRWLHRWFMASSSPVSKAEPTHYQHSALMDFVDPCRSPITRVLQYYSAMLRGSVSRLCLVWVRAGKGSFDEWAASEESQWLLCVFRQAVTTAASWVHRRFCHNGMGCPWKLASLADSRLPLLKRHQIADAFWAADPAELDETFSARLQRALDSNRHVFSKTWQRALWAWSWSVRVSIAPVEFAHGRNRRRASTSGTWASFVAQYVNGEGLLAQKNLNAIADRASPTIRGARGGGGGGAVRRLPSRRRRCTARDLHRFEFYTQRKALGMQVVVGSLWGEVNAAWEALEPAVKQSFVDQAEAVEYRRPPVEGPPAPIADGEAVVPPGLPAPGDLAVVVAEPIGTSTALVAAFRCEDVLGESAVSQCLPLTPDQLRTTFVEMQQGGPGPFVSIQKSADTFKADHSQVGRDRGTFPQAAHPRLPSAPPVELLLQPFIESLTGRLDAMVSSSVGKPNEAFKANLLVACEVVYTDTSEALDADSRDKGRAIVAHVASASSRAGLFLPKCNYIICEPALSLPCDYHGNELRYARAEEVEVKPLSFGRTGTDIGVMVHICDHEALARHTIESCKGFGTIKQVHVRHLDGKYLGGDRWLLKGIFGQPAEVEADGVEGQAHGPGPMDEDDTDWATFAGQQPKRQRRDSANEARTDDGPCDPEEAVDWLGDELANILGAPAEMASLAEINAFLGEVEETSESEVGDDQTKPGASSSGPSAPSSSSGTTDLERLLAKRSQCLTCMDDIVIGTDLCRALEYELTEQWRVVQRGPPSSDWDMVGVPIGDMRACFDGNTLQATCRHPGHKPFCKLLLDIKGQLQLAEATLCKWLIAGSVVTRADHLEMGKRVKLAVRDA